MDNTNKDLKWLSFWFVIHFIADISAAIPLMFFPEFFLSLIGWQVVDTVTARLIAAVLFAFGIESLLGRNSDIKTFKAMLNLKVIWSGCAILGLLLSIIEGSHGRPISLYILLIIFVSFNFIWVFFRLKLKNK